MVLYKNDKDPTIIPVNWQFCITNDNNESIVVDNSLNKKYFWEKNRLQNKTGTNQAYHPAKEYKNQKQTNRQQKNTQFGLLTNMKSNKTSIPKYCWENKEKISCKEKIKILNSNIDELHEMISDIYDRQF